MGYARRLRRKYKRSDMVNGIGPFPGMPVIDRQAETLEPVQPSAKASPREGMPEQEPLSGGPGKVSTIPYRPHLFAYFKVFYEERPPYEDVAIFPDIIDIRTHNEYNTLLNVIFEDRLKKGEKPVRVLIMNWKPLER